MAAAFSRLQLAAALLEYDNDPDDPSKPTRSAQESAIFANFRRNPRSYPTPTPMQTDYLGVSIDGEEHGVLPGDNPRMSRASALSINTIGNPFRADDQITEEGPQEEELEVDLASWGLDSFMPKEKANSKGKQKATESVRSQPIQSQVASRQPVASPEEVVQAPKRALSQSRSLSVGGALEVFGTERPPAQRGSLDNRRRSTGTPLDAEDIQALLPIQRRRASSYTMLDQNARPDDGGVPFPAISVRSASPNRDNAALMQDRESLFDPELGAYPRDTEYPTHSKQRTMSNATMGTFFLNEDNPFAVRPPSVTSRFDPKAAAHARTVSNASLGSRMLLEQQDAVSMAPPDPAVQERQRRYSTTLDLLRPKVLVMPSPLQGTTPAAPPPRPEAVRDGFEISTDGPPLPPGARSSRRASQMYTPLDPPASASNLFTPNPTASMSLSQMTFRNTLHVDGVGSSASPGGLPRATQEGEQVQLEDEEDGPVLPSTVSEEMLAPPIASTSRPAGKLYGKSLMDNLEERKAQMKSKSRTFYGDDRPTMMARNSYRSSTFIDPTTLQDKPTLNRSGSSGLNSAPNLARRNSSSIKPLLNFDDEKQPTGLSGRPTNLPHTRSVFGVDTLWEREMAKLKDIEAQEKVAEEERKRREEAEEARKKKKKKARKGKAEDTLDTPPEIAEARPSKVSMEPPVLPDIPKTQRRPPPVNDDDSDSEQSDNDHPQNKAEPDWHASSDEDDAPAKQKSRLQADDDDDLPLSAAHLHRSQLRTQGDSDDERPLSLIMNKQTPLARTRQPNDDEDEDEKPLGLRFSTMLSTSGRAPTHNEDDDDRPLGLHPEQQRRSQYTQSMAMNMQMQQMQQMQMNQQLFMQAQMQQQHTYFPQPPVMPGPFFGPPTMSVHMMQPPMALPPSPPPMQDHVKIGRIDSWRQNVAIEGDD